MFELLDQLGNFIREHSLIFLVGIIVLTILGGAWLLALLRNCRGARPLGCQASITMGYGILIGPPHHETPPPLSLTPPEHWDDKSD